MLSDETKKFDKAVNMETFIEETSMANEQHNETKGKLKISNTIIIYILVTGFVIEEYDWL